jgi:hypothetical protein
VRSGQTTINVGGTQIVNPAAAVSNTAHELFFAGFRGTVNP